MVRTIVGEAYFRQLSHAYAIALEYEKYAHSIGCHVFCDEIVANEEQAALLNEKWNELTKVSP